MDKNKRIIELLDELTELVGVEKFSTISRSSTTLYTEELKKMKEEKHLSKEDINGMENYFEQSLVDSTAMLIKVIFTSLKEQLSDPEKVRDTLQRAWETQEKKNYGNN